MSENSFTVAGLRRLRIEVGQQSIAGYESSGSGRPIVLIHGNSSSSKIWNKQLESLGSKYRLIAIDLPGHGASAPAPHPEKDYSILGYATCIASIAGQLGLNDAVFVGWSLGGHALLQAASALPMAAGLMILGTPPISKTADGFAGFKGLSAVAFTADPSEAEIESWIELAFAPKFSPVPPFFAADFRNTDGAARACLGASAQRGLFQDEVAIVSTELKIPLAILHGAEEQIVDLDYLRRLNAPTLWRQEVQVIENAGHTLQWEQPQAFEKLLDEFASRI
jgi:pimeloyl-ACP methyl ester carboxylesterase